MFSGQEFRDAILRNAMQDVHFPANQPVAEAELNDYLAGVAHTFALHRFGGSDFEATNTPSHGLHARHPNFGIVLRSLDGAVNSTGRYSGLADGGGRVARTVWHDNSFVFSAQRFNVGRSNFANPARLESDASNLPAVLNKIQGERPETFSNLIAHMREIFSSVSYVSVVPILENALEIRVWPTADRTDPLLSFSLNDSGTGVSQALAILTVAITMESAVVVIDEISSFLHPSAAKTLIRILPTNYPRHQYVVSTHSTELISSSSPAAVYLVRKVGFESTCRRLDLTRLEDLREVSSQLGVSMGDVFAADRIIWVEGPTEELCFPYLFGLSGNYLPRGVLFAPVVATGDFEHRRRRLILDLYRRLSGAALPLVKSVSFSFDREGLSDDERGDFEREANQRAKFLPRRNFESYLVDVPALHSFVTQHLADHGKSERDFENWLAEHGGDRKYSAYAEWEGSIESIPWLTRVDGASLISDLVSQITEGRLQFAKKLHSLEILQSIHRFRPGRLGELRAYVTSLVDLANIDGGLR